MPSHRTVDLAFAMCLAAFSFGGTAIAQEPSFRFVTQNLPPGTRNAVYTAQILTAHAKGPVSFGIASGTLPGGVSLDATTGLLTGRPTEASNFSLTFSAADGLTSLQLPITLQINASGGGGNGGFTFVTSSLPEGRIGAPYALTVQVSGGVGPFVFGCANLPAGLRFDGATGTISGTPRAAGTFEMLLSAVDRGEAENKMATILPLLVRPVGEEFRFLPQTLDNGAVGAEYECTPVVLDVPSGTTYSASALPPGLGMDPDTASISGTPTVAGTFEVEVRARCTAVQIAWNTRIRIVPALGSSMHWNDFALPLAMATIPYDRQPSIILDVAGAGTPAYTAVGLPSGITYNASNGNLSGTAFEVGVYAVEFRMTSSPGGEQLLYRTDFAVLPVRGGSVEEIASPLWLSKLQVKAGTGNADGAWKASLLLNSDRRDTVRFDGAEDGLTIELGSSAIDVPIGAFTTQGWKHSYALSEGGARVQVAFDLASEKLDVSTSGISFSDGLPGTLDFRIAMGAQTRRLSIEIDPRGRFRPTASLRSAAFVLAKSALSRDEAGLGSISVDGFLGDASFAFDPATDVLRVRLLHQSTVLLDRDLSAGASVKTKTDARTGTVLYQVAAAREASAPNACTGLRYDSAKGRLRFGFDDVDFSALPGGGEPVHLSFEISFGSRVFTVSATFFEQSPGTFALRAR